ncbi:MAG: hypothetical protein LBG70_01875 [Bifidobacteriaceae bacterium]|jgi:hypothetical protein|nr:hypothetical protein [Bifidobacteriaceae bacterium]
MSQTLPRRLLSLLRWAVAGLLLGLIGTFTYNASFTIGSLGPLPSGLVLVLLASLALAVIARSLGGISALGVTVLALFLTAQIMAGKSSSGDVLVPDQPVSYIWLAGCGLLPLTVAFWPRRWFAGKANANIATPPSPSPLNVAPTQPDCARGTTDAAASAPPHQD